MTGQTLPPATQARNPVDRVVVNFIPRRNGHAGNVLWAYAAEVPYHIAPWGLGGHARVIGPAVSRAEADRVAARLTDMGYYASPFPEGDGMIFEPRSGGATAMTDSEVRELAGALHIASGWSVLIDAAESRPGQGKADPMLPPWIRPRSPAALTCG